MPAYPFEPRSNTYLRPGQFWGVPLSDGRWTCGRVLAVRAAPPDPYFPGNSRTFLAALMDWEGDEQPVAQAIAGRQVLAQGWAHVKSIRLHGRMILGCRDLGLDGISRPAAGDPPRRRDSGALRGGDWAAARDT